MTRALLLSTVLTAMASGCAPPAITETGPTLKVKLDPPGFQVVSDTDTDPRLTIDTTTMMYTFELIVETRDGQVTGTTIETEEHPVNEVTGTLTIPGQTITTGPFDMPTGSDRTFKRTSPITLPGTVRTMTMAVHFEAVDTNGLQSNVINFNVAMQ